MGEGRTTKDIRRTPGEEGESLAEYVMILVFIAVACVVTAALLGTTVLGFYNGFNGSF